MREETIGECRLILGDCLEVMESLNRIDALVTDPPYCSGAATEAGRGSATHQGLRSETIRTGRFHWFDADNMTTAGLCELLRGMCVRARPLLHKGGSVLCFCDWRMVTQLGPAMESAGFRLRNLVVWDKGHFGCGTGFRPTHELILHLTYRAPVFHAADVGNVIRSGRTADKEHPTEKPVELISELVRVVAPRDGIVLDPFMGAGTTGVACAKLGRGFVGIETEPRYFDIACRRVEAAYRQADLFRPAPAKAEQVALL